MTLARWVGHLPLVLPHQPPAGVWASVMKKSKDGCGRGEAGEETVTLRRLGTSAIPQPTKPTPTISPYSFMRRSCTFVAESSLGLRKAATRTSFTGQPLTVHPASARTPLRAQPPPVNKVVKDRKNLAMQVRQKKDMLEESTNGDDCVNERVDSVSGSGRMSRLVGGLRAWSSTEDVRQSFMGAIGRTVSVIKQQPVSRRVKQAFGRPDPAKPETRKPHQTKPEPTKHISSKSSTKNVLTKAQPTKVNSSKAKVEKLSGDNQKQGKIQSGKFQFGKTQAGRAKSSPPVTTTQHTPPDPK